jgi:cell division protein FtsB
MKNTQLFAFIFLLTIIALVAYTQYQQQKLINNLTGDLDKTNQNTDQYRTEIQTLISNIGQMIQDEPDERKPIGFRLQHTAKA